jgi:DNA-binding transcriptional MocR family regulator
MGASLLLRRMKPAEATAPAAKLAQRMAGTVTARPERGVLAQPFHPGIPDIAAFPAQLYVRIQRRVSLDVIRRGAARCPAEGTPVLREQVAACWRRLNFDHLCRLNLDQGLLLV